MVSRLLKNAMVASEMCFESYERVLYLLSLNTFNTFINCILLPINYQYPFRTSIIINFNA